MLVRQMIKGSMSEIKYRVFLIVGVLTALAHWVVEYFWGQEGVTWTVDLENIVLSIVAAWIGERYVQKKLGIHLRWFGHGARRIRPFLLSIFGLIVVVWLAAPGVLESRNIFQFYVNVGIVYLLAGAFFEICNLIKVGERK